MNVTAQAPVQARSETTPDDGAVPQQPRSRLVRRFGGRVLAFTAFLIVWWAVTAAGLIKPLFLPSPGAVWGAFIQANTWHPIAPGVDRLVQGEQGYFLWEHLLASCQRIVAGVGAAIIFGPLLGFVMGMWKPLNTVLEPYLNFLRALPPLGYIGLLIVWFGIGDTSKVWLLFLAAFPAITVATISGVHSVPQEHINAVRSLGANRRQVLTHVVLPSTAPEVLTGIRIAVGFAWTTVVAAELNNGIPGIGGLAYLSGTQLNTPLTIACIIVIGITALLLDALIKWIGLLAVPWKGKS